MKYPLVYPPLLVVILFFVGFPSLSAQGPSPFQPVLTQMGTLEGARDPKCHATAARLEDFIYGTPLSMAAREARIDFQQQLVRSIWQGYTQRLTADLAPAARLALFKSVVQAHFQFEIFPEGVKVVLPGGRQVNIPERDFRQYSTVAYALRAILSIQQACYLDAANLAPLDEEQLAYFKQGIDIAVLALLGDADAQARAAGSQEIQADQLATARASWRFPYRQSNSGAAVRLSQQEITTILEAQITEKQAAYTAYNAISQAVFMRNIQVYFSKVPWPKSTEESEALKNHFTAIMVQFSSELLLSAQELARQAGTPQLNYGQMYQAVQSILPHSVNYFEDVTYFPRLLRTERTVIQSYDLDAFRDSGLHWQYLRFVLQDHGSELVVLPDPFALEMYVEGVAQFAVLLFRMAGEEVVANGGSALQIANLNNALVNFQDKLLKHAEMPAVSTAGRTAIQSAPALDTPLAGPGFQDITAAVGLNFSHRNSDWLSRLIRSYVVKESENLARLAIPPAFGGGGVAAEDIDNDGWADILLLSGQGNRLYKNVGGQKLEDITTQAGIDWQRPDGTYGEPRQPIIVDFDNDGNQDILITYANDQHRMYRNRSDGTFEDVSHLAQLGGEGLVAGPATVLDYDRDGRLDIYLGYFGNYLQGELPTLRRHNTNGTPNKLFRNLGGFRFADVSAGSGVENSGWTQAVGHADINGDGWQDLTAGNDFGTNAYYINQHDGTFIDRSAELGTDKPSYTMNVGVGDLNGDLRPDFYISNIVVMEKDDKYVLPNEDTRAHFDPKSLATMRVVEANDLFLSSPDREEYVTANNVDRGYSATGWSWDADFFDYDNDTDLDLYCLTGMNEYSVYGVENPYYASPAGETKAVVFATSNAEKNIFFENRDGELNVVPASPLAYQGTSRSAAYLDFDHDGDLDVVVNEFQGPARLFRNGSEQNHNHWASIQLAGNPARSNRDAIGANLIVTLPDGQQLWAEIHSTTGYLSGHPKTVHFGLGAATHFQLRVRWPGGEWEDFGDLKADQVHRVGQQ